MASLEKSADLTLVKLHEADRLSSANYGTKTHTAHFTIVVELSVGLQWNLSNTDTLGPMKCVLIREVSSFQGVNTTYLYEVGTWSSVLIREVSLINSFQSNETIWCHHGYGLSISFWNYMRI